VKPSPGTENPAIPRLSLFCATTLRKPVEESILPAFTRATGIGVDGVFDSTALLLERINAGARPDILIGLSAALLAANYPCGYGLRTGRHIVSSGIGVAAAPYVQGPSIATIVELVTSLTACRAVAYSRTSPSGIYFNSLLQNLGIAEQVNSRAVFIDEGLTARALIDGRADLAVQQISELRLIPETTLLGPLPEAVQHYSRFSVYLRHLPPGSYGARAFYHFMGGALARSAYAAAGLENV
jgi:molybdate transport system substrate-binding protein